MGAWKEFSISKIWFKSHDYELWGFYDRDIKYLGNIEICVVISQDFKIRVEFECAAVPSINKTYDNLSSLEEAEKIINQYFEKITELRKKLSKQLRSEAESAYNNIISNGYDELLKSGKVKIEWEA